MKQLKLKFLESEEMEKKTISQYPKSKCSQSHKHPEIDFYCRECLWPFYLKKEMNEK